MIFRERKEMMREATHCDLECEEQGGNSEYHTLTKSEVETMKFRFEFPVQNLCKYHYLDQFKFYSVRNDFQKCSDPCLRHKKLIKTALRPITLELAQKVDKFTEHRVIPGQNLCTNCVKHLNEMIDSNEDTSYNNNSTQELSDVEFESPPFDAQM